jgi:hypothetical protein
VLAKASLKKNEDAEYKSIKIPPFSDDTDWRAVVFELEVHLEKV